MNGGDKQSHALFRGEPEHKAPAYSSTERQPEPTAPQETPTVRWTASEFIDHEKGPGWIIGLVVVGVAIAVVVFLMTRRDWFASVITLMLVGLFGAAALRRPRILEYSLDSSGITIDKKHTPYEEFRAFSVVQEGSVESVVLTPTKRWAPPISLYYAPEQADTIVTTLGEFLPFEPRELGYVDKFLHKIRF